ncbi:ExeA family protein [Candidatus Omnitrophota bacterium]
MSYYKVLGLDKEPFSTSPDPNFFYQSAEHKAALTNILIDIRLKRGLSIVLGEVGTGKTTLSRKLFQMVRWRPKINIYMILDPSFDSEELFLQALARTFGLDITLAANILDLKEEIKRFLFRRASDQQEIVVLLIDEAQKLKSLSLEVLRTLLNYETNEFKLLQLVLLGQTELIPRLTNTKNLMDRVSFKYNLGPLNEQETKAMINFRLAQAGYLGLEPLFLEKTLKKIHEHTQGFPRRVAMLSHLALKYIVMNNKPFVDNKVIAQIIDTEAKLGWKNQDLLLKSSY